MPVVIMSDSVIDDDETDAFIFQTTQHLIANGYSMLEDEEDEPEDGEQTKKVEIIIAIKPNDDGKYVHDTNGYELMLDQLVAKIKDTTPNKIIYTVNFSAIVDTDNDNVCSIFIDVDIV